MNKKLYLLLFIAACTANISLCQSTARGTSNYVMKIRFDPEAKMISGETKVEWINPSELAVDDLQFHLYYNAFKNTSSTFMKDRKNFDFLMSTLEEDCGWSYSEITSLIDGDGNNLLENAEYISPDDGNKDDQTVLRVPLTKSVSAKDTATYHLKWTAKIPKAMIRTGYNQDYYFFAQWFPKLGVYEPAGMRYAETGAWNCHQYFASGEYYGEFGDYEVTLDVPQNYIVGASGVLQDVKVNGERKEWTFFVEEVIDFTWTASPHFLVLEDKWKNVDLKLYTYPNHEHFKERYFNTAKQSLSFMDENIGTYPYATLSMVDPPIHGLFTGGMEYPTLISSLSINFLPKGVKAPETLIVHEFVHQYFMQMVASHEQEEPWMDEGLTTYYEGRILDLYYGEKTSLIDVNGVQLGNSEYNRYEFWASDNPKIADNGFKARDFIHGGYGPIAYNKTAMMLRTLEGILGTSTFDEIMKDYFETWKFDHPCGLDFIDVFKKNLSEQDLENRKFNLDQFFEQALYGSVVCDYKVKSINAIENQSEGGFIDGIDDCISYHSSKGELVQEVVLERLGEMILPVEVLVIFKDGSEEKELWDGAARSIEYKYSGKSSIKSVILDPERKLNLEKNVINNSLTSQTRTAYKKYTSRFKVAAQHLLDFLNFLS